MASPEIKDSDITLKNVTCVYCGQTMGRYGEARFTDPATGRVGVKFIMEDGDLPRFCQQSPDQEHANMTPEQARDQGYL